MAMLVGVVGLTFGGRLFAEHRCYSYQGDFGSACQEAPAFTACANCRHYPKKKDCQGRPLSEPADNALLNWDRESVRGYFEDLRTVGSAVGRIATEMNIKHVDLL